MCVCVIVNKRKRVVLKNNFKRHRGTMTTQSETGNEGKTEDMSQCTRTTTRQYIVQIFSVC